MKNLSGYFDYANAIKYACVFTLFLIFNFLEKTVYPYSTAILIAATYINGSALIVPVLYICSFLACGANGLLAQATVCAIFCSVLHLIRKRFNAEKNLGFVALACLSLTGFLIIGDTETLIISEKRVLVAAITVSLAFFCSIAGKAVAQKGLKFKLSYEEVISVFAVIAAIGTGVCNATAPFVWKGISVFIILSCCYLFRFGTGTFIA